MRLRLLNAAAVSLLAVPGISFGLGLGEIQLKSSLNAPLNAEIELIATDEELTTLRAQLAARDTFTRYGLDYPSFLMGVQVRVARLANGNNVIQLTSSAAVTDPFATFLVEANWARGRIQREYTVLFDPPAFAPQQAAPAAPVAAPSAGAPRSGEINRPAPAVQPAPPRSVPAAPAVAPPPAAGGSYTVPSGDSLSSIAYSRYGDAAGQQAMIAIFRSNPQAFGSNINQLRAGSVLRLPDAAEVASIDRGEAAGEVRRQMTEWANRTGAGTPGAETSPRLVLVPPAGNAAPGTGAGNATTPPTAPSTQPAPATAPGNRVQVEGAGLARVQEDAAKTPPAAAPVTSPPAQTPPAAEVPVEPAPPAAVQTEPTTTPPVAETKPAAPAAPVAEEAGSSFLDTLKAFWYVPAGLIALLFLALGVRAARRRRSTAADGFAPFAIEPTMVDTRDTSVDTLPLRKQADARDPSIVVEESAVPRTVVRKETTRTVVDLDESPASTPSVDPTGTFEQGDPLAEADFHMAYGLYDQAADLVKLAIAREPARRDLKSKLLEVYFVWGNKEQFLQMARDLGATRDAAAPGEWEKVVIMGKQLAPEDPLFTQPYSGVSPNSVDLNLEGGQNLVDFDLPSESSTRLPALSDGAAPDSGLGGLDFVLDDPARGADGDANAATTLATQQTRKSFAIDGPTIEQPFAIDGPTVEQPALGLGDTLAGKLSAPRAPLGGTDQTAELSLDDLGLDLGKLEATGTNLLDDSQLTRALDASGPEAQETLVAGLDDTARQLLEQAGATQATELLPLSDLNSGDTSRVAALDLNLDGDGDSSNAETGKRATPDFSLDLDVGTPEQQPDGEYQRTQRIDQVTTLDIDSTQRDLEPVSMSEVGTKLDLARAYMDMGDPDGARSILGEVLAEGSPTQRQEAQRLLDSIPG